MESENTKGVIQKESQLAKWSLYTSLTGLVCLMLLILFPSFKIPAILPLFFWLLSVLLSTAGVIQIRACRPNLKGYLKAISGILISIIPPAVIICIFLAAFAGEPYDESNPMLVVNTVKKHGEYKFPEKMLSLKAAERLAGGPDNDYTFLISFKTDYNGFVSLQNFLSNTGDWEDITDELSKKDGNSSAYDPRPYASYKNSPDWYKAKIPQGKTFFSFIGDKELVLTTVCVLLEDSNDVAVYIEGLGKSKIKKNRNLEEK
jgi:hypothetical protein